MKPEILLVGGYVRDLFIDRPSNDLDYLVVGADENYMENVLHLNSDGAKFPVFRDRKGNEYALARKERKIGVGYHGFEPMFSPDVTIEEDLMRRDITINSIAIRLDDELNPIMPLDVIDPFNGLKDIENKIIRHTSDAFSEDPVRVLRVARFASQLHEFGFTIHPDTKTLMREIASSGELDSLTSERVVKELKKAFETSNPQVFFEVLLEVGALKSIFPEVEALDGVPQKAEHHPEIDCFLHTMMALKKSVEYSDNWYVRYMVLTHDLGKALTPRELLPAHYKHEHNGLVPLDTMNKRLKIPKELKRLSEICTKRHTQVHSIFDMKDKAVVKLMNAIDAYRKPEEAKMLAYACISDAQGRLGLESRPYPQFDYFIDLVNIFHENPFKLSEDDRLKVKSVGSIINLKQRHKLSLVREIKKKHKQN